MFNFYVKQEKYVKVPLNTYSEFEYKLFTKVHKKYKLFCSTGFTTYLDKNYKTRL